ncbi:MAG: PaaI family thioesterase, partial [Cobetia amphilecti]
REARLPKLIDFSIDYLATARGDQVTRIDCEVMREGRRMTNVRVSAWQKSREQPVASARMHFVLESLASP